eukprot:6490314-Amphidinium_carterae.2
MQRLCIGHDGVALIESKDLAKLKIRFHGVPNRVVGAGIGAVPEAEPTAVETAFHITRVVTTALETKREVIAVRGWRVELGVTPGAAAKCEIHSAPCVQLDAIASRLCALDLPKAFSSEPEWAGLLGGKRNIMREKLKAAWTDQNVSFEDAVLDIFRLSRVGDQMSMLVRIAETHLDLVLKISGVCGIFIRPMSTTSQDYHVAWYEKDEQLDQVVQRAKDIGALGIAYSKGKLGIRCRLQDKDRVLGALGMTHKISWVLSGLPTDATAETAKKLLTSFCVPNSASEVITTSRRIVAGRPSFVVKIPADESLVTDMIAVERTVGKDTMKYWVVLSKMEGRKTQRQVFHGKGEGGGSNASSAGATSKDMKVTPLQAPTAAAVPIVQEVDTQSATNGQAVKRRYTENGALVVPPPPLAPAGLAQFELILNTAIQSSLARMESMVAAQECRFAGQIEDLHRAIQETGVDGSDNMRVEFASSLNKVEPGGDGP